VRVHSCTQPAWSRFSERVCGWLYLRGVGTILVGDHSEVVPVVEAVGEAGWAAGRVAHVGEVVLGAVPEAVERAEAAAGRKVGSPAETQVPVRGGSKRGDEDRIYMQ